MASINEKAGDTPMRRAGAGNEAKTDTKRTMLIITAVALILIVGIWIWKETQISNVKKQAETERQALQQKAAAMIVQSHEEHLKLLAKPIVWAVRAEMMQGNLSQVNLYMSDMVKEKNFQRIVVANDKGIIVSSTNKKDEGKPFSTIAKDAYLSSNNTSVENAGDSILIMTSPIMGFNNRLGTLLINYAIRKPALK